jgi:hypothetical protein
MARRGADGLVRGGPGVLQRLGHAAAAAGPVTGYRPYAGAGAPDVLWFEGTAQMRAAETDAGLPTATLEASLGRRERITAAGDGAPLMADRTVTVGSLGE